jgi:ABC-type transporter Mla MlaB component
MRPHPGSNQTVLVLVGSIAPRDVEALCACMGAVVGVGAGPIVCDVGGLEDPDALTVDALARLQLVATRAGRRLWLRHAPDDLRELIALVGLAGVLPLGAALRLEMIGQAEEREECCGVQEEDDPRDPIA